MRHLIPRCYLDCFIFNDRPCFECIIYQVRYEERKYLGDWRAGYDEMELMLCTILACKEFDEEQWINNYVRKGIIPDFEIKRDSRPRAYSWYSESQKLAVRILNEQMDAGSEWPMLNVFYPPQGPMSEKEKEEREKRKELMERQREIDNSCSTLLLRYSRCCPVCHNSNPSIRSVFSKCGHIVCTECVLQIPLVGISSKSCPYCRQIGKVVRIFEDLNEDGIGLILKQVAKITVNNLLQKFNSLCLFAY